MEEKTDKELYKEFLLGNNKSFEEIVIRHKDSIIYFIQRYTKSVDIAEDLTQDGFGYILMHKKNYRFEYSLKTYLYTIAKSKALNYIKREKRIVALDENQYEDLEELEEKVFKYGSSNGCCIINNSSIITKENSRSNTRKAKRRASSTNRFENSRKF